MKFRGLYDSEYMAYISMPPVYIKMGKDGYAKKTIAQVVSWLGRGEDTYIVYSYSVGKFDYLFAWLTPYDERHRSYGNHSRKWYDGLVKDIEFEVSHDSGIPWIHRVETPEFAQLNQYNIRFLAKK